MSAILPSTRGGKCGICHGKFKSSDPPFTHRGGEGHDGFHKKCLAGWLRIRPTCPIDKQTIDPSSTLSRMEQIRASLPAFSSENCFGAGMLLMTGGMVTWIVGYTHNPNALQAYIRDREALQSWIVRFTHNPNALQVYIRDQDALESGLVIATIGVMMAALGIIIAVGAIIKSYRAHAR